MIDVNRDPDVLERIAALEEMRSEMHDVAA